VAFAELLGAVIDSSSDLEFAGAASSVREAVQLVRRSRPHVILLDARLPDGDGAGVDPIAPLRHAAPGAKILVLKSALDSDALARALDAGAAGFVRKRDSVHAVMRSIRAARDGEIVIQHSTLASILGRSREPSQAEPAAASRLTRREIDVLTLMGRGLDPQAIASQLHIRISTCRGYQKNILAKLDAHSQLEAVVIAIRQRLIPARPTDRDDP
jgi:DNA-binding NarL/FixJ family response regulator